MRCHTTYGELMALSHMATTLSEGFAGPPSTGMFPRHMKKPGQESPHYIGIQDTPGVSTNSELPW